MNDSPGAIERWFLDVLLQPLPIGKQSAMSKRGQEAISSEGSPMAKPKPMVFSEGETRQLGVTQPVEREGKSSAGFAISGQSGESR